MEDGRDTKDVLFRRVPSTVSNLKIQRFERQGSWLLTGGKRALSGESR